MKNFIAIILLVLSFNAAAQEENTKIEDAENKKLMVKQIEIIKSIKNELKKLLK